MLSKSTKTHADCRKIMKSCGKRPTNGRLRSYLSTKPSSLWFGTRAHSCSATDDDKSCTWSTNFEFDEVLVVFSCTDPTFQDELAIFPGAGRSSQLTQYMDTKSDGVVCWVWAYWSEVLYSQSRPKRVPIAEKS